MPMYSYTCRVGGERSARHDCTLLQQETHCRACLELINFANLAEFLLVQEPQCTRHANRHRGKMNAGPTPLLERRNLSGCRGARLMADGFMSSTVQATALAERLSRVSRGLERRNVVAAEGQASLDVRANHALHQDMHMHSKPY